VDHLELVEGVAECVQVRTQRHDHSGEEAAHERLQTAPGERKLIFPLIFKPINNTFLTFREKIVRTKSGTVLQNFVSFRQNLNQTKSGLNICRN
jgi:hypothetical protein